jgi:peptidoglycan/LPS O-acetylase OafA/YrhL
VRSPDERSSLPSISRLQAVLILVAGFASAAVGGWAVKGSDVPTWFAGAVMVIPVLVAVLVVRSSYHPRRSRGG